jgi:hypothetical protein
MVSATGAEFVIKIKIKVDGVKTGRLAGKRTVIDESGF